MGAALKKKLIKIKMLLMDVDGTMTDGGIIIGPDGNELKRFHAHDGLGINLAHRAGLITGIISARFSAPVEYRARALEIKEVFQGVTDKSQVITALLAKYRLTPEETAFIGDDLQDLAVFRMVGVRIAVANAVQPVFRAADFRTRACGGYGAVREAVEVILRAQGKWDPHPFLPAREKRKNRR
ncbi:MAG: KdsC family phosphatase [Bacillota bacterium]